MVQNIYAGTSENILKAARLIKEGKLVAFPTDTVYGLGANALDAAAVASIFSAKGRPRFDPLISHVGGIDWLQSLAHTDSRVMDLARRFWPGPLTFVLKRKETLATLDLVCSGLPHIAVRMPNHPVALALIQAAQTPIAAPSANKFKSISPTTAAHVSESLGDKVPMILDGGACAIGVETTIIDLTTPDIVILRAGGLSKETIEDFTGEKVYMAQGDPNRPSSPGQLLRHYAPQKPVRINALPDSIQPDEFYIGFGGSQGAGLDLSPSGSTEEAAARLFAYLRLAESDAGTAKIAVAPIPCTGLGLAVNDRLKRASYVE